MRYLSSLTLFFFLTSLILFSSVNAEIVTNNDKCNNCDYITIIYYATLNSSIDLQNSWNNLQSAGYSVSLISTDSYFGDYFSVIVNNNVVYITNNYFIEKKIYNSTDNYLNFVTGNDLTNVNNDFSTISSIISVSYTFMQNNRLAIGFNYNGYIYGL